ncbi:hypothetical protein ACFODO_23875 [Acinetobacter sichuanensis]|uniref:HEPN domain-containing protein n=1 Tax=Acinetobacter sichuanensis TaxID=2136183 RepID=A0A371YJ37_9GAMM|nr:hypothetical protein [Acinetobacter sichuanensis]RFC81364.1 hypothetical protein C9E89_022260 [Acinetobacter sichuanensis]
MKFKPYYRLLGARDIFNKCEQNEATYRSVIHQSYYASYNQLVEEIENRLFYPVDVETKKKSVHKAYLEACINKQDTLKEDHSDYDSLEKIINDLKQLRGFRAISDYEIKRKVNKSNAELSIILADRIFNAIEKLG